MVRTTNFLFGSFTNNCATNGSTLHKDREEYDPENCNVFLPETNHLFSRYHDIVKFLAIPLLLSLPLLGADSDFNGRWNLVVKEGNDQRSRAWWLEVEGAGTKNLKGKFVGAPGGQMDVIPTIRIDKGELEFVFRRNYRVGSQAKERDGVYRARIHNDQLTGTFLLEGNPVAQFTGTRAPVIRDKEDGSWKKGNPISLFNGTDLTGWKLTDSESVRGWSVKDGLLVNSDKAPDIVTKEKFWNFELHAEFKVGPKSNSGIALRDRYEVQIWEDHGRPLDGHSMGALYSRIVPSEPASKPAGEWQTMDIRLVGRIVTVKLNGKTIIDKKEIEGLTAMAHDSNEAAPGPLSIQGDHGLVEFRKLVLTPLVR